MASAASVPLPLLALPGSASRSTLAAFAFPHGEGPRAVAPSPRPCLTQEKTSTCDPGGTPRPSRYHTSGASGPLPLLALPGRHSAQSLPPSRCRPTAAFASCPVVTLRDTYHTFRHTLEAPRDPALPSRAPPPPLLALPGSASRSTLAAFAFPHGKGPRAVAPSPRPCLTQEMTSTCDPAHGVTVASPAACRLPGPMLDPLPPLAVPSAFAAPRSHAPSGTHGTLSPPRVPTARLRRRRNPTGALRDPSNRHKKARQRRQW